MLSSLKGFYQIEEHKTLIHTKKVKVSFSLHIYLCAITVHIYLPAVIHELENLWEKKKNPHYLASGQSVLIANQSYKLEAPQFISVIQK